MKDDDSGRPVRSGKATKSRRSVLKTTLLYGGGVLALVVAGAGGRLLQTGAGGNLTSGPGFDPWRAWEGGQLKGPEGVVVAATLAPSPHNTQPWKFTITGNNVDLFADTARNLGALDPIGREMMIGLGCAVENMVIGAQSLGFTPIVNVFPAGTASDHVARLTLFPGERTKPPEAAALARRHTNRGPYLRERAITNERIESLNALARHTTTRLVWIGADSTAGERFIKGTVEATEAIIADADMYRDTEAWYRHDLAKVNATRDGISTTTAGLAPVMTRLALTAPGPWVAQRQPQYWLQLTRDVQLPTAPMFGLLAVPAVDDRPALIEAGRLWQRLHLAATLNGLAMQPLNQMMEMADRDRALNRPSKAAQDLAQMGGYADSVVVFGFRMGYAKDRASASPRRGLEQVITA